MEFLIHLKWVNVKKITIGKFGEKKKNNDMTANVVKLECSNNKY